MFPQGAPQPRVVQQGANTLSGGNEHSGGYQAQQYPEHTTIIAPCPPGYTSANATNSRARPQQPRQTVKRAVTHPLNRSMSFLTTQELFSYKAIPAIGVVAYLATSVGTIAHHETFEQWFGSEYAAIMVVNGLTATSIMGTACYMYGRRHIRHAGAFQKLVYPLYGAVFFNCASHFSWAFIKEVFKDQDALDYHWRMVGGILSGMLFLHTGRRYLHFVDTW